MTAPDTLNEILIPSTRTPLFGMIAALGAAFAIALVAILLSDASLTDGMRTTAIGLGGLWALGFALMARRLFAARTGLLVDHDQARLGFCISQARDLWWVSLARIAEIRGQAIALSGQTAIETWICQVRLKNQVQIVVVESGARESIDFIVEGLVAKLKLPPPPEADHAPWTYETTATTIAVSRGGALQGVVLTFGLALALTGILAFGQLGMDPIVGFILGPLLLALGLVLLTTAAVKRFAKENLRHDGYYWYHHFSVGKFVWNARKVKAKTPIWRITLLGARGGYLELKGDDGSIIIGASARAMSHASIDTLSRLPDFFHAR